MSEIIHKSSRGTVEVFEEDGKKRIRRTVNAELPLYEMLKNSECEYLPRIYSVEIANGKTVVAEEFISKKNLLTAHLDEKQVIRAMVQLCAALDFIHGLGIVHRDIKPSNILLSEDGNIRLIDFEAARIVRDDKDKDTRYLGTDGFAPPEQYGFSQTDFRTDIYAAGQTMKTLLGSLSAKRKYAKIIRKCTALDPAERYQSAKALADALNSKREKVFVSTVLATAAAVLIFAAIVPKEAPAENISDEAEIVAETETAAEITTVPETGTTTITTTFNERDFLLDWLYENDMDKYLQEFYGELTCYGQPENIPDYNRDELIFLPTETADTKIFFISMKEFIEKQEAFYMYFDMDSDGSNEAFWIGLTPETEPAEPFVQLVYGVPYNGGYSSCVGLRDTEYINDYKIDENCFIQVTCFNDINFGGDYGYAAVTVGDGKSFNITEMYMIVDGVMTYRGSCWGETKAVMDYDALIEYFANGCFNYYMLVGDNIWLLYEYDYEEYRKIKDSGDENKLREMFEQAEKNPWQEEIEMLEQEEKNSWWGEYGNDLT